MPSVLRVTNLDNGQSTIVRVNDRGPYARARVLDVSRAAAEELGMTQSGTARVRIEQLEMESQAMKQIRPRRRRPGRAARCPGQVHRRPARAARGRGDRPSHCRLHRRHRHHPVTVYPSNPRSPAVAPIEASGSAGAGSQRNVGQRPADRGLDRLVGELLAARGRILLSRPAPSRPSAMPRSSAALVTSYGSSEISPASSGGREVYRVRLGPYSTQDAAGIVADRLKRSGYGDARVVSAD
jgi:rare lipoprotein A